MASSSYQDNNVRSSKCRKSFDNETCPDRISQLPDVLVHYILSFLPTKEAVATSVLSKRWLWVWTFVPTIDLEDSSIGGVDFLQLVRGFMVSKDVASVDFVQLVTRVLMLNKVACLDKFRLKFNSVHNPVYVRALFWAMVSRDVREIDITIINSNRKSPCLKLPSALFTSKALTVLKLDSGILLHVPETVSFPSLKILHLVWIKFANDESVPRLFSGCPLLQELILQRISEDNNNNNKAMNLDISIPTLKHLSLTFFSAAAEHKLKINAPILEYLNLQDNLYKLEYDVQDVSRLLEAEVTVSSVTDNHLPLVKALHNAKFLSFHWDWYSIKKLRNNNTLFINLVRLELDIGYDGWGVLSRFLESSHNLQVLVLIKSPNCRGLGLECSWKPRPKRVPKCLLSCLELVCFRGFEGLKYQLRVVKYILKNARVLKMMDICCNGTTYMPADSKFEMLKKLSMFQRASKICQLQFN